MEEAQLLCIWTWSKKYALNEDDNGPGSELVVSALLNPEERETNFKRNISIIQNLHERILKKLEKTNMRNADQFTGLQTLKNYLDLWKKLMRKGADALLPLYISDLTVITYPLLQNDNLQQVIDKVHKGELWRWINLNFSPHIATWIDEEIIPLVKNEILEKWKGDHSTSQEVAYSQETNNDLILTWIKENFPGLFTKNFKVLVKIIRSKGKLITALSTK